MAARFTKLQNALTKGLKSMTVKAAVDQIDYWEEQLADVEVSGAKGILADLKSLKTKLSADEIDEAAVRKLLGELGGKTARIAERVEDEKLGTTLKEVGSGLDASA